MLVIDDAMYQVGTATAFGFAEQFVAAAGYEFAHWFNFYQHADVPGSGTFTPTYRLDRGD